MTSPIPCKICDSPADLHGVVDFNKSCETHNGRYFFLSGTPVWYHRCGLCGFLFTAQFDHWTHDDWRREVYNEGYANVDPEAATVRPRNNAAIVAQAMRESGASRALDYGGGDGDLAATLQGIGMDVQSFDVLWDPEPPAGSFELVTAFEVFEHTPTPVDTMRQVISFMPPHGLLMFSTLTLDDLAPQSCDHWYIAPRNGHVSIHTRKSLGTLFGRFGWGVQHLSDGVHLARRG